MDFKRYAYLSKPENIVNKEKHILPLSISEVLSHSQSCKANTGTSTRGLIHLTIYKSALAFTLINPIKDKMSTTWDKNFDEGVKQLILSE